MDESERDRRYYLCVAIVDQTQVNLLRKQLSCLLMPGQRELHFYHEKTPRRRALVDKIARLPVTVRIYQTRYTPRTDEDARQACLELAVTDLLNMGTHRLVIDTRAERDRFDGRTIRNQLSDQPAHGNFSYEHNDSKLEPLCWIADTAGWCFGAGGNWRRRIMPIIDDVIEL
ncbi:MAG TPA: hypothetical protein VHX38_05780 [Pseudonocardiaceae bacterium]|jgi:hypothetical protein|nr:hypothetical protein [Pseudonocardiaceae bacterium]